jgi:hypothetical protein
MHAKYGEHNYQQHRNGMYRAGKDGLLIEIGKYGLTRRDLVAPVNFFSKVSVDEEGAFHFHENHAKTGDHRRSAPGHGCHRRRFQPRRIPSTRARTTPRRWSASPPGAPARPGRTILPQLPPGMRRALHNTDMQYLA